MRAHRTTSSLHIIKHYIEHSFTAADGISPECRGELAAACEDLAQVISELEADVEQLKARVGGAYYTPS